MRLMMEKTEAERAALLSAKSTPVRWALLAVSVPDGSDVPVPVRAAATVVIMSAILSVVEKDSLKKRKPITVAKMGVVAKSEVAIPTGISETALNLERIEPAPSRPRRQSNRMKRGARFVANVLLPKVKIKKVARIVWIHPRKNTVNVEEIG